MSDSHIKEQTAHLTLKNFSPPGRTHPSSGPLLSPFLGLELFGPPGHKAHPSHLHPAFTHLRPQWGTLSEITNPKKYNKLVNMTKKEANLEIQKTNLWTVQWLRLRASTAGVMVSTPGQRSSTRLKVQLKKKKKEHIIVTKGRGKEGEILG